MSIESSFPNQIKGRDNRVIVRRGSVGIRERAIDVRVTEPNPFSVEPNGQQPIVVANGFTEGHEVFDRFARRLAGEFGQTVVTFSHFRDRTGHESPQDFKANNLHNVIRETADATGDQVTVIGHSEAGTYGTRVVHDTLFEEDLPLVSAYTLASPAGVTDMSVPKQVFGFGMEAIEHFKSSDSYRIPRLVGPLAHVGMYLIANIGLSAREGIDVTKTHSTELLSEISHEIPTTVIGFDRDKVILAREIQTTMAEYGIKYWVLQGTHTSIIDSSTAQRDIYSLHTNIASSPTPFSTAS